ncbi:MAG TPA: lactate utilization protein [Terriglobales bacterium]|jgi:L-lactate dehydrogenase complex protein LldG
MNNPGRERILARIQKGLGPGVPQFKTFTAARPIFPAIPDPLARFIQECRANRTEFVPTADSSASSQAIAKVLLELPAGEIFVQDTPELRAMATAWAGRQTRWSSEGPPRESGQASITTAEALVAATGSILLSTANGGRTASVVPPVHIVVAEREQLVSDLESALKLARERGLLNQNTFLCLTTGSSRTADIEKILVMGAHGPKRLVVVVSGCE